MSASEKELEMSDEEFGTNCELVKDFINVRIEWIVNFQILFYIFNISSIGILSP